MHSKLDIYYDKETLQKASKELLMFGLEVVKRAKCIKDLEQFNRLFEEVEAGRISPVDPRFTEYHFEWLIDTIRIGVFFEAYFKAMLILNGHCVHEVQIEKGNAEHQKLKKTLAKKPVPLTEVHKYSPFIVDNEMKTVKCAVLKPEFTIGLATLLKEDYLKFYQIDKGLTSFVKNIKSERNRLHFFDGIERTVSEELLSKLWMVNGFIEDVINKMNR